MESHLYNASSNDTLPLHVLEPLIGRDECPKVVFGPAKSSKAFDNAGPSIKLRQERELTFLFGSHDFEVTNHLPYGVVVMSLGRVVETVSTENLLATPSGPLTKAVVPIF